MIKIDIDTYLTSDQHFGHNSIIDFEPIRKNILGDNYEAAMIELYNSIIKDTDSVLFLGDFSFKDPLRYSKLLNGNKYLILGNHDRKGDQPYIDFRGVQRGITIDINGSLFTYTSDDPLLSAYICTIFYNSKKYVCGFCHYTPSYNDIYDDQRESAKLVHERKIKIDEIFKYFGVELVFHGHLHSKQALTGDYIFINTCVEHHSMKPVKIKDLLKEKGL